MVNVEHLVFRYDQESDDVVRDIGFDINDGEIFGFLGPSGAGKSTAQKILTGQLRTYSGSVRVEGMEIKNAKRSLYNRIGVAFEFPNLYDKLTATENLRLFSSFYDRHISGFDDLLRRVNLYDDRNTRVASFSKGMKMRLNFVRSFMHKPDLLFLDEPTSGLDPVNARLIREIISDLKNKGTTIFLTTHNMHDADVLCDRLALIDRGELLVTGSPADLKVMYGEKKVKVTLNNGTARVYKEFDMRDLGTNTQFLEMLRSEDLETIHSGEASLEDVFIKVTGHGLSGSLIETEPYE
jgi:fluoroquinolone transport system ATP-binding protein